MSDTCCVPGCTSSKLDVYLHAFPRSQNRFQTRVKAINDLDLYKLNKNVVIMRRRVCQKHFASKYIRRRPTQGTHFGLTSGLLLVFLNVCLIIFKTTTPPVQSDFILVPTTVQGETRTLPYHA